MNHSRIAASTLRLAAAFTLAAAGLVFAQEPTLTPQPAPAPTPRKEDAAPRSRKEPSKQETTASATGKGAAAEKAEKEKQAKERKGGWTPETLAGLELRSHRAGR